MNNQIKNKYCFFTLDLLVFKQHTYYSGQRNSNISNFEKKTCL